MRGGGALQDSLELPLNVAMNLKLLLKNQVFIKIQSTNHDICFTYYLGDSEEMPQTHPGSSPRVSG